MQRREFLASAAAVASAGPFLLGMTRKAGDPAPVVGSGDHRYQCFHDWGQLPPGYTWQTTHNVALDSQGLVYITHQGLKSAAGSMDTVLVFDPAGKFVRSFGKEWHGGGHGIEIRKEGSDEFIYLSNTGTPVLKVVKTDLKGKVVWEKGRPEAPEYAAPKANYSPTNICFRPDGGFTVGDGYGSHYLMNYDRDGKLTKVYGGPGDKLGQLRTPHGQWVDARDPGKPVLVVCDRANARLQWFGLDGTPLAASAPRELVLFPAHAKTRGDVLLVPDLHARVSLLDRQNRPIVHLGEDPTWRERVVGSLGKGMTPVRTQPKEWPAGKFVHPHDATFDAAGNIFVVEWVSTGRITFLKKVS
jgi:DNA-binding beta-propeller fold protein YncE